MKFFQAFSMALKSILQNKMRSFLTMLGIIIGVGSVTALVSVMQGTQRQVIEEYKKLGANTISVSFYEGRDISRDLREFCQSVPKLIAGVTPNTSQSMKCRYKNKNWSTTIYFGNEDFGLCQNYQLEKGRGLSYSDLYNRLPVCVIGSAVRQQLFGLEDPIGKQVRVGGVSCTVVGLYKERAESKQWSQDDAVLLPQTVQRAVTGTGKIESYTVKAHSSGATKAAIPLLESFLKKQAKAEYSYNVYSSNQWAEQDNQMTGMLTLVVGGIAGISLLVGGIGIMNIMLVSVSERTREIGIRMAIGAPRRAIVAQFLIEAATISACGGILGLLVGSLGSALLSAAIFKRIDLPTLPVALGAFLFSVLLGMFFGFYPAGKASKMQPVDALRSQ